MALKDILKFQLKKVNPFQGLVIDADTWRDAHNYHRDQQRLHTLIFHKTGIVEGLEVKASDPPDLTVTINPGVAVEPEGNTIIVPQTQRYKIQTREKRMIYLIIQFREVPTEPYQPPEGGQPTRILEAYRIEEREKLPSESHLELARIDFDPAQEAIKDAANAANAGKNEINLSFRQTVTLEVPEKVTVVPEKPTKATKEKEVSTTPPKETITIGHTVLGDAAKDLHSSGLKNLVGEISRMDNLEAKLEANIPLDKGIDKYTLLYINGNTAFELTEEQQTALGDFLKSGGIIFGEGCSEGQEASKGSREFGLAFNQLASQLKNKLEIVQRGHLLLSTVHVFSSVPDGAESGMLMAGGGMVYSGSDYGCAWQGGHQDQPLPRDIIRSSIEIGTNIAVHAHTLKSAKR